MNGGEMMTTKKVVFLKDYHAGPDIHFKRGEKAQEKQHGIIILDRGKLLIKREQED